MSGPALPATTAMRRGAAPPRLVINGKFAACRTTGVQRVAEQLVRALDEQVSAGEVWLCTPPGARHLGLCRITQFAAGPPGLPLQLWEQVVLPWQARGSVLLHLAGAASAWHRRTWCVFHDAAPFDVPQAYTRAFGLWYRWLYRHMAQRAEQLLTVSHFSQHRLAGHLGVPAQRLLVLPNAADHQDAHGQVWPAVDDPLPAPVRWMPASFFLAVASANPNKNLRLLRLAHARMAAGRPALVLVGGRHAAVFRPAAQAAYSGQPDVFELGPVDDAFLLQLYRSALALVCPSAYEGFGLPALEAMRQGCPVLTSGAAALRETCGDAALVVDALGESELAQAMQRLVDDQPLRQRLAHAGPVQAARYRWRDSAATLLAALRAAGVLS